jgi:3-hydroxyacyl-CoA dehydrogenase/enoyl-CoA hydratase/3-hydroxybutyryl-CoA epimerase
MEGFQATSLSVEIRPGGIALLWLDVPGRAYNVFNRQVLTDLDQALDKLAGDSSIRLLVAVSRKTSGFLAGADLREFTGVQSPADAMALSAAGQRLFDKVAGFPVPTVAVIHGPCLGGGLEFALACDYRIAIDQPGTQLGLPELKLGLIPAWGGTQRLPRVVGIERAFQIILQLRQVNAPDALRWGLVDAVQPSQEEALALIAGSFGERMRKQGKRPKGKPPVRTWRQRLLEATPLGRWALFRATERIVRRRLPDDMPAPLEALQAVRVGIRQGLAAGLIAEREAVGRLATTNACRNLITLFFLMENARKSEAKEERGAEKEKPCPRVGVVGAGTMGAGIAQLAAVKGWEVVVQEVNDAALQAGVQRIEDLFNKAVANRVLSADDARRKLESMGKTTTYAGFDRVDLVIEAAVEDLALKKKIFQALEQQTRPDTILATNTSSLSVQELQQGLAHPERVGGLHFFNPVHKMPLVEVIQAPQTAETVSQTLTQWAAAVGKTPVLVKDSPGFVVNRILFPYLNEAGMLVAEGMPIEIVDRVMRRFGMPMGPLELLDQVGLDVAAHVAKAVGPVFRDRLTPHSALEQMCARGWLGQKSGAGFYRYQGKKKQVNAEALATLLGDVTSRNGAVAKQPDPKRLLEARERMVLLMVNEAAAYLAEGLAPSADVIDLAMVLGTGWAPQRGGPLRYADDRGTDDIVATLEQLVQKLGPRFEPCAELRRRAATKEPFYHLVLEKLAAKLS